jgi:uncharacterized repeat protein (TIGR03803 family)
MQSKRRLTPLVAVFTVVFGMVSTTAPLFGASKEKVLNRFNGRDGESPGGSVIFDSAGNLYGTTVHGGASGVGNVYELSPQANGSWKEKVLHTFDGADGDYPESSLIFDSAGNLYGTAAVGGAYGDGTVFELSPNADGSWKLTTLYSFGGKSDDGGAPMASLIFDVAGNLYGTTSGGGAYRGDGTVFELSPAGGSWTETVLYSFNGKDGESPESSLIFDAAGNLYGTTYSGGGFSAGVVFELSPGANGKWTETVLHRFAGQSGAGPYAALISDASGNLYGTTVGGGTYGVGTVFELSLATHGTWKEKVLHNFQNNGKDGIRPYGGVIFDKAGSLFGTTLNGGSVGGCAQLACGTAFELSSGTNGNWTEKILYRFIFGTDGLEPSAGLVFGPTGNLYGTTGTGGSGCGSHVHCGTVFEITP